MATTYARQIQRQATSAAWAAENPVLAAGELGWDLDEEKFKAGDGITAWNDLGWYGAGGSSTASDFFTPEAFGAVGDGIANDTDAVQAAMDAAYDAGGGTVLLRARYGWTGDLLHRGAITVRGVAVMKVLTSDDEMDRGLVALSPTARYRYGQWAGEGASTDDNPGGLYDLVIQGAGIGGATDGLLILQCVDGVVSNCRIVDGAGNGVLFDGTQNSVMEACWVGGHAGANYALARIGNLGQGAGSVKINDCYGGTSELQVYADADPANYWPHDVFFNDCLFENYTAGMDMVHLRAGDIYFTRCVFTNSNAGLPLPPNECLVLVEQDRWPTIPTQASFDGCYFNGSPGLPHLIRSKTFPSTGVGNHVRLYGKTYAFGADFVVGLDGGGPFSSTVTLDGDVFRTGGSGSSTPDWYETLNGAWLLNVQRQSALPTRYNIPTDPDGFLPDPIVMKRAEETVERFRISRDGVQKWIDGTDGAVTRGSQTFDAAGDRMVLGGRWQFANGLELRGILTSVAAPDTAVALSAARTAAPYQLLHFTADGASADVTISGGNVGAVLLIGMLGTGTNTVTWSADFKFEGTAPAPEPGKYVYVTVKQELDGDWHEVSRSTGNSGGGGGSSTGAGEEVDYSERTTNFTTTNVTAGNAAGIITGQSITVEGNGRPVEIEFQGLVLHTTANTVITAALIEDGVNTGYYAGQSSPSTSLAETIQLKRRIVIPDGVTRTYQVALSGAVAGTVSLLTIAGTSPSFLQATRK